jgi:hypothetical protein
MKIGRSHILAGMLFALLWASCRKQDNVVPNNNAPYYGTIATVLVENYINRSFIDLIGREPLDAEMGHYVQFLRDHDLSFEAREQMLIELQTDTNWIDGDTSYHYAYHQRMYDLFKARFLEGAGDQQIKQEIGILNFQIQLDTLQGNWDKYEEHVMERQRYIDILLCRTKYRDGSWTLDTVCEKMIDNGVYDYINMNTFNFVNASFDNYFWRYPTEQEFWAGYWMVENNEPHILFQQSGSNKTDYVHILISTSEFLEGNIIWAYKLAVARDPSTQEVSNLMWPFSTDMDLKRVQRKIMVTDEYAGF